MKTIFAFSAPLLLGASIILTSPSEGAETYRGKIDLRGSVQNVAKPGSLSFVITGRMTTTTSSQVANITGGGLFRTKTNTVADTNFTGPLRINVNVAGDRVRTRKSSRITVSRRSIRFPGGTVRLDRAINPNRTARQNISGKGDFRYLYQ